MLSFFKTKHKETNLINEFEKAVRDYPDNIALKYAGKTLTYQSLNAQANQVAHYLKGLNVIADKAQPHANIAETVRVGVYMRQTPMLIINLLAIFKVGYVFVPLSAGEEISDNRRAEAVKALSPQILITERLYTNSVAVTKAKAIGATIILFDEISAALKNMPIENIVNTSSLSSLAYIYFTSGSTGKPKGVMNNHQGLVAIMNSAIAKLDIKPHSHVANIASIGFDAFLMEVFMAFMAGATLHMPVRDKNNALRIKELPVFFRQNEISKAIFTPSLLSLFSPEQFQSLTHYIYTGELITQQTKIKWKVDDNPNAFDGYGLTECKIGSLLNGFPMQGVEVRIYNYKNDNQGNIDLASLVTCEADKEGEIFIAGNIGQGYWDNEPLTKKSFISIEDPENKSNQLQLYRTGDLGVKTANNKIIIKGRIDRQLKIHGKLLCPQEIEEKIASFRPDIISRVYVDSHFMRGGEHLKIFAFIFFKDFEMLEQSQEFPDLMEIQAYLETQLAKFMIPTRWVFLPDVSQLPNILSENKKFDRKKLWEFWDTHQDSYPCRLAQGYQAFPLYNNQAEEIKQDIYTIIQIWCETLGLKDYPAQYDDHFYRLGGTSILSAQLLAAIEKHLTLDIHQEAFTTMPTIGYLIRRLICAKKNLQPKLTCLSNDYAIDNVLPSGVMPVFLIHALLGNAREDYKTVIHYFPKEYPIFSIDAIGLTEPDVMWDNLDEMTDMVVPLIKALYKGNNLIIGGWSAGGVAALNVQQILQKQGYHVSLIMFDTSSPLIYQQFAPEIFKDILYKLFIDSLAISNARQMTSGFSEDNLAKVMDGIAFDKWPKAKIISHLSAALKAEINFFQGKTEQQKFYYQALITTITNIVLSILKMQLPNDVSNITLYSASETAEQFDERLGWPDNWDIDIKQVNGAHSFMLEPEVLETLSMSDDIESIAKQLWTSVLDVRAANAPTYISNLIKHAPNNLRWRFMRGKINAHNGQRDLALFDFKKIFKILEKRSDIESALYQQTLLELAITYQRLADSASTQAKERAKYEKAITYFAKIANPDVTALRECGHCYRGLERYSSAISKFKQAISLCTEDYRNYYYLGKLYLDLGDYVPARDNLKLALDRCESTDFNHADISALLREAENHIEQNPNVNYQRR